MSDLNKSMSIPEIEKFLKETQSPITLVAIQDLLRFKFLELYMGEFGFVYSAEKELFEKPIK